MERAEVTDQWVDIDEHPQLLALKRALGKVPAIREATHRVLRMGPTPSSPAADDGNSPLGVLPWQVAVSRCGLAVDPLSAWRTLFDGGTMPITAHLTLCRSTLEAATTARCLLDAKLSREHRTRLAVFLRLEDLRYEAKFQEASRPDVSSRAAQRRAAFEAEAATHGIQPLRSTASDRIRRYAAVQVGQAGDVYGLLSSLAHGMDWSLIGTTIDSIQPGDTLAGTSVARTSANIPLALFVTELAVATLSEAVAELAMYGGVTTLVEPDSRKRSASSTRPRR